MLSTARSWLVAMLATACAAAGARAAEDAPRSLRVPVVGMVYEVAAARFDPLPATVLRACPTLADNGSMRSVLWIYAAAPAEGRTYYVVGGYGVRARPRPPDFPRYEPLDEGTVFATDGEACTIFGEAREVFATRYFEETPQPLLRQLADDLMARLSQALGGRDAVCARLRRQRPDPADVSPELRAAVGSACGPAR